METGKPGLASAPVHISSVSAQAENRMDAKAPLTAVYIHALPALPAQTRPEPPTAACEPATLHLAMAPLYSKDMLPFLTLNIAGGLPPQLGIGTAAAVTAAAAVAVPPTTTTAAARLRSAGKHVCPHCGRDCLKPSVLEKHLRCHTGERPYPCTTCGVSFKTQSNLYKHRRTQAHARLSSESEQSSLGSLDGGSRETCTPSLSLDERSQESVCAEKVPTPPAAEGAPGVPHVVSVKTQSSPGEAKQSNVVGHHREPNASEKAANEDKKQKMDDGRPPLAASQHLPLQRQEATLFSKQWERSLSRGKSQSHESTDSGFSESSDHYPSPGSVLPEHGMDPLSEAAKDGGEATAGAQGASVGPEPDGTVREQEKKSLEERISKLISDNTAVVEDKQLENVRPRKTVLSKQGSIDLPMPYTYKDSFHFEMRNSQGFGSNANRKPELFSSVPSQRSSAMEHAPLTRSNSLPFSVTLLQPEKSSPTPFQHSDYVTLVRRGSSGQINPTGFAIRPVSQPSSTHRTLVRQAAVDCNSAADGLFAHSSLEEARAGSLSCDGDICGEPGSRKFQRKKAQKFAYNKWYMYGGGTFKKLYSPEKGGDNGALRGRKCSAQPEHKVAQGLKRLQSEHKGTVTASGLTMGIPTSSATWCPPEGSPAGLPSAPAADLNQQTVKAPLRRNLSLSVLPLPSIGSLVSQKSDCVSRTEAGRPIHEGKHGDATLQLCGTQFPSNRKKQRTECKAAADMETNPSTLTCSPPSVTNISPQQGTSVTYINLNKTPDHPQLGGALPSPCKINANTPCASAAPGAASIPSPAKKSFLPKYQLKLPNTTGTVPDSSPQLADKPTETFPSEQPLASVTTCSQHYRDPAALPATQTCHVTHKMIGSTKGQGMLPCIFTANCQNLPPCLTATQRRTVPATVTTSCRQDHQAGLCSTLIQSSKYAPQTMQIPPPVAHATLTLTTANNQTPPAAALTFSHLPYPNHALSEASTASDVSNSGNGPPAGPEAPVVPCHIVPLDQSQPAAPNIFHVNTADLQICLQIISDEQLALIEPQIERPSGFGPSQVPSECVQDRVESFAAAETNNGNQGQKQSDKGECLLRITPPLSVHFVKAAPGLNLAEGSKSSEAPLAAVPSETPRPPLRPHHHAIQNTATNTQSAVGDPMPIVATLSNVNSEKRPTSEEVQRFAPSCAEERLPLDRRVSKGGAVTPTLSCPDKLCVSGLSPNAEHQVNRKSEALLRQGQDKVKNERDSSEMSSSKASCEVLPLENSKLDAGESLDTPFKHARGGPTYDCAHSLELTPQGARCSATPEKQLDQRILQPSNVHKEKLDDFLDVHTNTQRKTPESLEGASFTECAAHKVPQSQEQKGPQWQRDGADWRLKQIKAVGETSQPCWEEDTPDGGVDGRAGTEGNENGGARKDKSSGRWDVAEPSCRYTVPSELKVCEGEDGKVEVDATPDSRFPSQHPPHLPRMHSGMSECSPKSPQPAPSAFKYLSLPARLPKPPVEGDRPGPSLQTHANSVIHDQQTCESRSRARVHLSEEQNALSGTAPGLELSHAASNRDSKPASVPKSVCMGVSCWNDLQPGSHNNTSLLLDASQVSSAPPGGIQAIKIDQTVVPLPKTSTLPEKDNKHDALNRDALVYSSQSLLLAGPLYGCQPMEGLRPVQSCQDYAEDTSSSDEEGKLIIEL